jgi:predicted ABC-type ATPase
MDVTLSSAPNNSMHKRIVIIAGPNGAGKTTFAREFLPNEANCPNFVNADLIALGLSPFDPDLAAFKAGRLMLETISEHAERGESFAFETTLSGLTYAQMIPAWQSKGYTVSLIFLSLPDEGMALARVAARVRQGGHNVPDAVVKRRFTAGIKNLERYKLLVNAWQLYDNSGAPPILLEEGRMT